jgi:polyisoprenoid-binding protein YceI
MRSLGVVVVSPVFDDGLTNILASNLKLQLFRGDLLVAMSSDTQFPTQRSIGRALPQDSYSQEVISTALLNEWAGVEDSKSRFKKIHRAADVRRQTSRALVAGLALAMAFVIGYRVPANATEARVGILELDPSKTIVEFKLEGSLHNTHGTFRLKRGTIKANEATGDAQGKIVIDAASGNSGNILRDNEMHDSVLEASKWPEISFDPLHLDGQLDANGDFQAEIQGVLLLHGAPHDAIIEVQGRLDDNRLVATGHLSIPYVKWGLKDPSILFLTVAKDVEIDIQTTGRVTWLGSEHLGASPHE